MTTGRGAVRGSVFENYEMSGAGGSVIDANGFGEGDIIEQIR